MCKIIVLVFALSAFLISCGEAPSPEETFSAPEEQIDPATETATVQAAQDDTLPADPETEEPVTDSKGPEGFWTTTMGEMEFTVDDSGRVSGIYPLGSLDGIMDGSVLQFTYVEGSLEGEGTFTFNDEFSLFQGIQNIAGTDLIWNGQRK